MKYIKKLGYILSAAILLVACDINELPTFDDKDAFVSFPSANMSVEETGEVLKIPVLLSSLKGIEDVAYIEVTDGTAKEGVHFDIEGDGTLNFTGNNPVDTIIVNVYDNDVFEGDVSFEIALSDAGKVNLGSSQLCAVTIVDDEHPLAAILGTYTSQAESYFNGAEQWEMSITKDAEDLTKVWFYPFVNGGSNLSIYGVVNDEKTEIRIPVDQEIVESDNYPAILLKGYYGPDGATAIPTGGFITILINGDGTLAIQDEFGSQVFEDEDATVSLGWYNIYAAGGVLTKK